MNKVGVAKGPVAKKAYDEARKQFIIDAAKPPLNLILGKYLQTFVLSTLQLFVYIFVNLSDTPSPHGGNSDNGDKAWAFIGPEKRPGVLDLIDVCHSVEII